MRARTGIVMMSSFSSLINGIKEGYRFRLPSYNLAGLIFFNWNLRLNETPVPAHPRMQI